MLGHILLRKWFRDIEDSIRKSSRTILLAHSAWALGQIGDARAAEPLRSYLNDKNDKVRETVQRVLLRLEAA